jgi:hypothetical protein
MKPDSYIGNRKGQSQYLGPTERLAAFYSFLLPHRDQGVKKSLQATDALKSKIESKPGNH